jgi:hypothetical protein
LATGSEATVPRGTCGCGGTTSARGTQFGFGATVFEHSSQVPQDKRGMLLFPHFPQSFSNLRKEVIFEKLSEVLKSLAELSKEVLTILKMKNFWFSIFALFSEIPSKSLADFSNFW